MPLLNKENRKESLEQKQERMKLRLQKDKTDLESRPVCIACKRRKARLGDVYCSRCSGVTMIHQHRDLLPRFVADVIPPSVETVVGPIDQGVVVSLTEDVTKENSLLPETKTETKGEKIYTRAEAARIVGVAASTLKKWERKGKIPQPRKIAHNNQCVYTEELVETAQKYKDSYYEPPSTSSDTTSLGLPKTGNKAIKIGKRMEKAVARHLGSLGRLMR